MSNKSGLTKRQKQIIQMLVQFSADNPVTVQAISENLKLSSRTVLREMPFIDAWFDENDFSIVKKPRVGIYIDEDQDTKVFIQELVEMDREKVGYSKEDRQDRILFELFMNEEPLKYFYFTSLFHISEGTLSGDFDELEQWLENYNLQLIRKPGVGVSITGREEDYRQALIILLRRRIKGGKLETLRQCEDVIPDKEDYQVSQELLDEVNFILKEMQEVLDIQYTEHSEIHLTLYIILTTIRIEHGHVIKDDATDLLSMMHLPECQVANWIGSKLGRILDMPMPEGEVYAIAMQLLSAKIWKNKNDGKYTEESFKIRRLVIKMVVNMERILELDFLNNQILIDGLCNHMRPASNRMRMGVFAENGQLDMVKETYPEVFEAVVFACEFLKDEFETEEISEEELGFVAMYFCVAIEKMHTDARKISVCVACPHGVGTSRMLSVNLQKEFPEIHVEAILSTAQIDVKTMEQEGIDLIISTYPLAIDFPNVCVTSSLKGSDKALIRKKLHDIHEIRPAKKKKSQIRKRHIRRDDIEKLVILGREILQVLDNIKISSRNLTTKEEIMNSAGELFARNPKTKEIIMDDLKKREDIASTYLSEYDILFLHSETKGVRNSRLGYLAFDEPIMEIGNPIRGAIVMLIPYVREEKIYKEVMSEISGALAQNEKIISYFFEKNRNAVVAQLEASLGYYYEKAMEGKGGTQT